MKILREVTFNEVVHAWLMAEWFKNQLSRADSSQIESLFLDHPDFDNKAHNSIRSKLLKEIIGRSPMIDPLPQDTLWYIAKFEIEDTSRLYVVPSGDSNNPDWIPISNGNFKMSSVQENIESKFDHAERIKSIYSTLPNPDIDTRIILVGCDIGSLLTIIEGNHRGSALIKYLKDNPRMDKPIIDEVFVGLAPSMKNYIWHIESRNLQ